MRESQGVQPRRPRWLVAVGSRAGIQQCRFEAAKKQGVGPPRTVLFGEAANDGPQRSVAYSPHLRSARNEAYRGAVNAQTRKKDTTGPRGEFDRRFLPNTNGRARRATSCEESGTLSALKSGQRCGSRSAHEHCVPVPVIRGNTSVSRL